MKKTSTSETLPLNPPFDCCQGSPHFNLFMCSEIALAFGSHSRHPQMRSHRQSLTGIALLSLSVGRTGSVPACSKTSQPLLEAGEHNRCRSVLWLEVATQVLPEDKMRERRSNPAQVAQCTQIPVNRSWAGLNLFSAVKSRAAPLLKLTRVLFQNMLIEVVPNGLCPSLKQRSSFSSASPFSRLKAIAKDKWPQLPPAPQSMTSILSEKGIGVSVPSLAGERERSRLSVEAVGLSASIAVCALLGGLAPALQGAASGRRPDVANNLSMSLDRRLFACQSENQILSLDCNRQQVQGLGSSTPHLTTHPS